MYGWKIKECGSGAYIELGRIWWDGLKRKVEFCGTEGSGWYFV